jgi:AraC family transcriptional regulator
MHKGLWSEFPKTSQYIFGTWLPASPYEADTREHFEVMGEKYFGPDNPDSEEEIWVPVKAKLLDS